MTDVMSIPQMSSYIEHNPTCLDSLAAPFKNYILTLTQSECTTTPGGRGNAPKQSTKKEAQHGKNLRNSI